MLGFKTIGAGNPSNGEGIVQWGVKAASDAFSTAEFQIFSGNLFPLFLVLLLIGVYDRDLTVRIVHVFKVTFLDLSMLF